MEFAEQWRYKVNEKAYVRREISAGPYGHLAPEIQITTRYLSILPLPDCCVEELYRESSDHAPALHRTNGILFMKGQGIKSAASVTDAHIEDLAPTIVHMSGMPVPEDMEGKILLDCFTDEFRASHEPSFEKQDSGSMAAGDGGGYSQGEEEEIRKTLQGLGYLS